MASPDLRVDGGCVCGSTSTSKVLWLRLNIALSDTYWLNSRGSLWSGHKSGVFCQVEVFWKRRRLYACGDCCYICIGARHDKKDPLKKIIDRHCYQVSVSQPSTSTCCLGAYLRWRYQCMAVARPGYAGQTSLIWRSR